MIKYCIKCGKKLEVNSNDDFCCPNCKTLNKVAETIMDTNEVHHFNQSCHQNMKKAYDLKQNSLCFIVIAGILLIVGAIFLLLSFKYDVRKVRVFTPGSFEFIVCILCLAGGLFCMIFGIIRLVSANKKTKYFSHLLKK
jgi:NAD-dependent SIR2 family protein deacetylase